MLFKIFGVMLNMEGVMKMQGNKPMLAQSGKIEIPSNWTIDHWGDVKRRFLILTECLFLTINYCY